MYGYSMWVGRSAASADAIVGQHPGTHEPTGYAGVLGVTVPEWTEQAVCAQVDPEAFFPEKGSGARAAKAACAVCPVRAECLEYALEHHEQFGIWGGMNERQRRQVAKGRAA